MVRHLRQVGLELVRALCVLTLFLFNFAHAPVAYGGGAVALQTIGVASICGATSDIHGGDEGHLACHACRIGAGADVPAPVAIASPAFSCTTVAYAASPIEAARPARTGPSGARAPPVLS